MSPWIDATLILSPRALRFLGDSLSAFGELLPIHTDDQQYCIFNCRTLLDNENAQPLVFKAADRGTMELYCFSRLKDIVQAAELVGITFCKLPA